MASSWDTRVSNPVQLPSIDEGFGSLESPYTSSPSSIKCESCASRGHTVWIPQGTLCPRCAINKLTPPPDQPGYRSDSSSIQSRGVFSSHYESETDPLARRSNQGHNLPRSYHDPYASWASSTTSSPLTTTASVSSFAPSGPHNLTQNPYHRHSINTTPFQFTSDSSGHGNKKPAPYRSEKDIRHCDAEKARRDHQATYIDMGFSLRNKFQWPEESSASAQIPPSASSSFMGDAPSESTSDNDQRKRKDRREAKEKLTKQSKLHQQVLWEFRACLRIDRDRVREWLDEVKTQGEELKRRKRVLMEGHGRGGLREGERERDRIRCVKDEAVMEVWSVMEREFHEFCAQQNEMAGGASKRKKIHE